MIPTNGDATLLRFAEDDREVNILIDGGYRKDDCISYLKAEGVTRLDLVIASHLDSDHIRGLRRVADEIPVDELWITDVSTFAKQAVKSLYMLKCFCESKLVVDGKRVKSGKKFAVYDGFQQQIGPFFLEVLSPPKSLHAYLKTPNNIERILESPKGKSIGRYVQDKIKKRLYEESNGEDQEKREKIVSEVIESFNVDVPQGEDIKRLFENEEDTWKEQDKFYESARSLFNDISIVVKITFDYKGVRETFLFPGDLTNWSLMMAGHSDEIKKCVTKIPHHGSTIYTDVEELLKCLFIESTDQKHWKGLPRPLYRIFEEFYCFNSQSAIPYDFWVPTNRTENWLSCDLDSNGIYKHLNPKHSLIYPLKSSFGLPRLDVRDAIKAHSSKNTCNFEQGKVSVSRKMTCEPCVKHYDCQCRKKSSAIVLEW
jgi:hypothetical protein